ncbi:MAG: hypothetical protein JWO11_3238 [Nocardioides sp.]|nr:hypothetical protein [Nocardioides sp.]
MLPFADAAARENRRYQPRRVAEEPESHYDPVSAPWLRRCNPARDVNVEPTMSPSNPTPVARPRRPGRLRARAYAVGAVVGLLVAGLLGALSAADADSDGAVLSGFLAALWAFATYVVLVNVVELGLLFRGVGKRRALRRATR